ncbi:POK7 protein, partial [Hypocryptadius cinnamomeus]|nr:POK7 protein [Hypocryptadius cinnamomeus]
SVIDLKDAFWTCPLARESRDYFAFQWEDPNTNRKQQLRWTSLPQGFVDSPNLFGQALEQVLSKFTPVKGTKLLQYVDDLLIPGPREELIRASTIALLNFLGDKGLKVSKSKLQFTEPEVKHLGHWLTKDCLSKGVRGFQMPEKKKELQQALLVLWRKHILDFSIIAYPLFNLLRKGKCWEWTPLHEEALQLLVFKAANHQALRPIHPSDP